MRKDDELYERVLQDYEEKRKALYVEFKEWLRSKNVPLWMFRDMFSLYSIELRNEFGGRGELK